MQPDTRYFCGLEGRYEYSLHFRVYSTATSSTYITRSMHGSGCLVKGLRSVTADLDLPAGTYRILLKVTAERFLSRTACGQVVEQYNQRREKLLQAGRNFDLAHAKGKRRDKEAENKAKERDEARQKKREVLERERRARRDFKSRERKRKERVETERDRRRDLVFWKEVREKAARKGVLVPEGLPDLTKAGSRAVGDADAEIGDDDFDWDPEVDGSVSSEDSDGDETDALYADDPWNAVCVLGLRVYSLHGEAGIQVVEGEYQSADGDAKDDHSEDGLNNGKNNGEEETRTKDVKSHAIDGDSQDTKSETKKEGTVHRENDNESKHVLTTKDKSDDPIGTTTGLARSFPSHTAVPPNETKTGTTPTPSPSSAISILTATSVPSNSSTPDSASKLTASNLSTSLTQSTP